MNVSEHRSGSEFRFGEGKISGWISVLLGSLSVLGVLCFQFPDFLTTPQLRQAYTADQMRYLLGAGMIFSAAFGLITFILNRHKLMGAIGTQAERARIPLRPFAQQRRLPVSRGRDEHD